MRHGIEGRLFRQVRSLRERLRASSGLPFSDLFDARRVLGVLQEEGVYFRERVFNPLLTLWTFLTQVLSADQSCR